jgi:hypothetical protein
MHSLNRRRFLESSCLATGAWLLGARRLSAAVRPGVETVVAPMLTGEELSGQPDIWAFEVRYKPMRMLQVELTNPRTKRTRKEHVWYLAYRAVVRPSSHVPENSDPQTQPVFVPEITFVTEDEGKMQIYPDQVLPEAQAAINRRERHNYKNSVEIVGPLPKVSPDNAKALTSLDGVAMWTGIDPDTDFFSVYLTGFSNGYKTEKGPNGKDIVLRRTLQQKFWRPSDRFDQDESEIRFKEDPNWMYR